MTREEIIIQAQKEFENSTMKIRKTFYSVRQFNEKEKVSFLKDGFTKKQLKDYTIEAINEMPSTPIERFYFFTKCFASFMFEYEKLEFIKKYTLWKKEFIDKELKKINEWIELAKETDFEKVFNSIKDKEDFNNSQHEYIRLETDYYKNHLMSENLQLSETSLSAKVYGRYFLFKDYLKALSQNNIHSKAEKYFGFMVDNKHFNTIQDTEYTRFINCIDEYIETRIIPTKFKPFKLESATKWVLAKVFHKMYKLELGNKNKNSLVEFMASIIIDFKEEKIPLKTSQSTLSKNMANKPKLYDYIINGN